MVASFKSTLDEALDASLLLNVIDASDAGFERQLEVTDDVLKDIGADSVPKIRVFNKIDHVGDLDAQAALRNKLHEKYPGCMVMSARNPNDITNLHQKIIAFFQQDLLEMELFIPWANQQLRGQIYANCQVLNELSTDDGTFINVRGEPSAIKNLQAQLDQTDDLVK